MENVVVGDSGVGPAPITAPPLSACEGVRFPETIHVNWPHDQVIGSVTHNYTLDMV